jgi:outer membrane protein assembly factor BamB
MGPSDERITQSRPPEVPARRLGRGYLWVMGGLAGVFAGLLVLHLVGQRVMFFSDAAEMRLLEKAPLKASDTRAESSGEWPQWRGPRRDGVSLETGLLTVWPRSGLKEIWRTPRESPTPGYSCLAVSGGRLFTLIAEKRNGRQHEAVVCFDAVSGKELWRYSYPCTYDFAYGSGPRSTPTVEGEYVYTVGATGTFLCLRTRTGEKVWEHNLLTEFGADNLAWGMSFSPLIVGELIYTNPGGPDGNSLAAFNKSTGKLVWKALDDKAGYSSPIAVTAAGAPQIIFFTGKALVSVSPEGGKLYWRYPWKTRYDCNVATPIAVGDYLFISSYYDKGCAVLHVVKDESGRPQVKMVYESNQMCNHFSSCVYYQEHLYGFSDDLLTCMEFRTGRVRWQQRGFHKGSLTLADGHLIILGDAGRLALAEATPEGYREKSSAQVGEGTCWTVPVVAGGRLYVRDEKRIVCLDLKQ